MLGKQLHYSLTGEARHSTLKLVIDYYLQPQLQSLMITNYQKLYKIQSLKKH